MKTLTKIFFLIAGILLLFSCSKSDPFTDNDLKMSNLNKAGISIEEGDVYTLTGKALYQTWKVKDGAVLQDNRWDCTATLEFLGDRNFKYSFTELRPGGPSLDCYGKISDSGTLTFKFPAPLFTMPDGTELFITDIIRQHACAEIWGEGINEGTLVFKGRFDGTKFVANAYFFALIEEYCPSAGDLFPTPVDGPVHWTFGYDLDVD